MKPRPLWRRIQGAASAMECFRMVVDRAAGTTEAALVSAAVAVGVEAEVGMVAVARAVVVLEAAE